jgi:hypothetical protein
MPTIPRTDFYLKFDEHNPNLIWIDRSDFGDYSNPNPLFPKTFNPEFKSWESHWFPRLTEIRDYTARQLRVHPADIRFITDDDDLLNSYGAYMNVRGGRENVILRVSANHEHPDKMHYPYKMIHNNYNDPQYINEQQELMKATHVAHGKPSYASHPPVPQLQPKHQYELQRQQSDHEIQRRDFHNQLGYHGVRGDQYQYHMHQLDAHQREDHERLLARHQMETQNHHLQGGTHNGSMQYMI